MDNIVNKGLTLGIVKVQSDNTVILEDAHNNIIVEVRNKKYALEICKAVNNYDSILTELKRLYKKYGYTQTGMIIQKAEQ